MTRVLCIALLFLSSSSLWAADTVPEPVEFNRDIRPILADNCFACHGPDHNQRKADLRLDTEEGAFADLGGIRVLEPGKPEKSELFLRITEEIPRMRMPPAKTTKKLSAKQIELIRRWILQGAHWQQHWAFVPPRRPDLPAVQNPSWGHNPIDAFILARLEREGLHPSPEADRTTLLRRVTLDLTGLPPTPEEVKAFLADTRPDAYEKVVDRLLASPAYGERLARPWLDAARYADTNGYQSDGERTMWRWRDWVLEAYNANKPFDTFTVEQLAGDLLPNPTLEQRIATGFNRNHRGNGEGGVIAEEYAVEYVVDRVETTATVWLGLTLGCARCHDHKYDPFSQKNFYQLFAFFNNVPESGKAVKFGNSPPMIKAPTREQQRQLHLLEAKLARARKAYRPFQSQILTAQKRWEEGVRSQDRTVPDWNPERAAIAHFPLEGKNGKLQGDPISWEQGLSGQAAGFSGKGCLEMGDVGDFGYLDKFTLSLWVLPQGQAGGTILSRMTDEDQADGYQIRLVDGKVQVNLVKRWLDDSLRVETNRALQPGRWQHVLVSYDGSRVARGVRVFINGKEEALKVNLDELNQSFQNKAPLRIGGGNGPGGRFHGLIDEVRIYRDELTAPEREALAVPESIPTLLALPAEKRTASQANKLRLCFLEEYAPQTIQSPRRHLLQLVRQRKKLIESFPTTMVMEEMARPRQTHVLIRGRYDKPGEKVSPAVPERLLALPAGERRNRLGLAHWLVHPDNPLTARVAVNRYWQMYFGTGLVKTAEDFGTQGEPPSHPALLDWLATEFIRSGWDVKRMQRLLVTSATYRQSSRITRELLERDPDNRLLARGPRYRLSAESIRDQALAAGGLLVRRIGGPSVNPYQPAGLWKEVSGTAYEQGKGPDLHRRSLYTFWKRTVAPPDMMTFDATTRETCTVRRSRTNTPLQALTLLNDVTFVEAARALAARAIREGGPTVEGQLRRAFQLVTARPPRPRELAILQASYQRHLRHFENDPQAAKKLLAVGMAARSPQGNPTQLAAHSAVASLLLNLDEVLTKE